MHLRTLWNVTGLGMAILAMTTFASQTMAQEHAEHKHEEMSTKSEGKTITINGEVVDIACYTGHDAKGEKHASCAEMCINGGQPAGIVTSEGKLYIVLGENHKAPSTVVKDVIAKQVTASGKLIEKGGNNFLVVSKIESEKETNSSKVTKETKENKKITYTCSMHPEVVSDKPGDCPKCGMTLVLKK